MTPADIVTTFIQAIEAKDIDQAIALTSPDVSYENMPIDPIVGHDGMRATLEMFLSPASSVEWQILNQWQVGDTVINERLDRFEIGSGWLELPIAGVFRVADGKITLWRDYFDMDSYQRQFKALTS